ncbi:rho GTPase-activating protein 26 isoform X2 [Folsomia candida]|uniref:rho GTPase-activating protein 26 isoform X2 n=1 Tax=Folsomia candida TaxID=158441 RepID=UPI001604C336|nr:rho GTPase-activating protein 26 isoform X2 [Folsomia candida]
MGLKPLEFKDCLTDSPYFRENLHAHEKELEKTSSQIKVLVKDVKEILNAARSLSRAQRALADSLEKFTFECIGSNQTDDEIVIADSLRQFGHLISAIEDERDRMLEKANDQFIKPLDDFRKKKIGDVKDGKKKFEKQTTKFCQSQERYLNLSTKKQDTILQEADASLEMEQRHFCQASLKYVFLLQEVQECKKYEFVETLLGFMYSWLTFYHQGHEVATDYKPYMVDLQKRIQNTRENFETTRDQTKLLMNKMLELRKSKDPGSLDKMYTRQGYLYLMEKKALGSSWTKYYCMYEKGTRKFSMIAYNQISGKITGTEEIILKSCIRRMSDSIEKRFCFDLTAENRPGIVFTLQALSEEDRRLWLDAMDGREPTYGQPGKVSKGEETSLDDVGFSFVQQCIAELESRGLEEQGLYRLVGVSSKVSKLLTLGLERRKGDKLILNDRCEWETKTITSALKTYFRNLPEPLMTFRFHEAFIAAAKQDTRTQRIADVHTLIHRLPPPHFRILDTLIAHLHHVAAKSEKNKMTISNLGVCFGPTLLRPEEESVAAIIDIKFCNVVVEILIDSYEKIFQCKPPASEMPKEISSHFHTTVPQNHRPAVSPIKHTVVTYNDGPKPIYMDPNPMRSSWDNIQLTSSGIGIHQSTATVNSLHSSSHSSSSNQSSGEPLPLSYSLGSHSSIPERDNSSRLLGSSQNNSRITVGLNNSGALGDSKGNSYSQPYLNNAVPERNLSNSSSSSESVASWPGHPQNSLGIPGVGLTPPQPPPYQPPPEHPLINGRDNYGIISRGPTKPPQTSMAGATGGSKWEYAKCARTLYSCVAEHEGELSFEPNEIITNVRPSVEPGWLEGTLRGKTGLIPENYVEALP